MKAGYKYNNKDLRKEGTKGIQKCTQVAKTQRIAET